MDTVSEKYILFVIHIIWIIWKQQQRPDKAATYLDGKHGPSKCVITRTVDVMVNSIALYCKPLDGKDLYNIFYPLSLCEYEGEVIDSETDNTYILES